MVTHAHWRQFDYLLLITVTLLIILGVVMIRSATLGVESLADRVSRQVIYGLAGFVAVFVLAALDYHLLASTYLWIYGLILLLLFSVGIVGQIGGGAQSWLNLGVIPVQPSELAKVLLILVLAQQLSVNYEKIGNLRTILSSLLFWLIPTFLVFIQPDLGIAVLMIIVWFAMVWAAGLRWQHLTMFIVVGLVMLPFVWSQMLDYQRARITTFLDPGANRDLSYTIDQALISIGSGGLLGKGYAQGTQSQLRFLRVRHTDFIFSVIAEELGFVGAVLVLVLLLIVVLRILRAAQLASDPLGSLICYGMATIIFVQTVVSVGMNLSLLPVTGLTLPFVSSGGSSLVTLLMGIGLVESVLLRHPHSHFRVPGRL
jgi:rod shape determining protein RodA